MGVESNRNKYLNKKNINLLEREVDKYFLLFLNFQLTLSHE